MWMLMYTWIHACIVDTNTNAYVCKHTDIHASILTFIHVYLYMQYIHAYCTSTKQIRAFSVVGPSTWNGLPPELRIFNRTTSSAFFLTLRLLCLTVLVLGALLSSFLEEALYKCSI